MVGPALKRNKANGGDPFYGVFTEGVSEKAIFEQSLMEVRDEVCHRLGRG